MYIFVCVCEYLREERDARGNKILQLCICQELSALPLFLSALKLVCMCVFVCACVFNVCLCLCVYMCQLEIIQQLPTSPVHLTWLCLTTYIHFPLAYSAAVQSALHWSPSSTTTLCLFILTFIYAANS